VGAGPAGLVLSHLLHLAGVESVVLEARSREHVEHRVRAGVLEHGTTELLERAGVGDRMRREGMIHHGLELRFAGRPHRIDLSALTDGKAITVYGQQEVVKDLIAARLAAGGRVLFDVEDVRLDGLTGDRPVVRFRHDGREHALASAAVAGCDGFHGVSRGHVPPSVLRVYERVYPYAWLGILAEAPPSAEELIYASHERGFALHSMRGPHITRLYLQVEPDTPLAEWPDDRIWAELHARLALDGGGADTGFALAEGPILERGVTGLRSFVAEPMRYGRLFLAGDAAHIVPATGAKGLNLAVADVRLLAEALTAWLRTGDDRLVDAYSARCLRRVWRVQHFSWWMTQLLHTEPAGSPDGAARADREFAARLRLAQLEYVVGSAAAARTLAENYVGLPLDWTGSFA
jgi:p-hydroxybenzoate 3-monooxygenase